MLSSLVNSAAKKAFRLTRSAALIASFATAGLASVGLSSAHAQTSNDVLSQPVTIIVPFAAGGSLDATARAISEKLGSELDQTVIVVNRPGAGSSIGARAAAESAPDGHTLFLASGSTFGFVHLLLPDFDYGVDDFAPVGGLAINTSIFVVNPSVPVESLNDLVELADSRPEGISFCTTGANGLNHLQLEMFKEVATKKNDGKEPNITHIPYNGVAPALTAVRSGDVDACTLPYSGLVKQLHGEDLRVIAVQTDERLAALPDVKTTGEQGYAELDGNDQIVMLLAPAATPENVLNVLEVALENTMTDPAIVEKLTSIDVQPAFINADDTREWLENDVEKLSEIIQNAGLALNN